MADPVFQWIERCEALTPAISGGGYAGSETTGGWNKYGGLSLRAGYPYAPDGGNNSWKIFGVQNYPGDPYYGGYWGGLSKRLDLTGYKTFCFYVGSPFNMSGGAYEKYLMVKLQSRYDWQGTPDPQHWRMTGSGIHRTRAALGFVKVEFDLTSLADLTRVDLEVWVNTTGMFYGTPSTPPKDIGAATGVWAIELDGFGGIYDPDDVYVPPTPPPTVLVTPFSSSGTFTKNPKAQMIRVIAFGAGGGGGGGAHGPATATTHGGGGGGGGGGRKEVLLDAADVSSPVAVTIGVGGTGGTGATSAGDGGNGGPGGSTTFGAHLEAFGGGGGSGGSATGSTASSGGGSAGLRGSGGSATPGTGGTAGSFGGVAGGNGAGANAVLEGCGGAGNGRTAGATPPANTAATLGHGMGGGAGGGSGGGYNSTTMRDGSHGGRVDATQAAGGTSGGGGSSASARADGNGGCGGGGGAGSSSATAGAGGNGQKPGGGGGGGGTGRAQNGGNGGNGGDGFILVIEYLENQ